MSRLWVVIRTGTLKNHFELQKMLQEFTVHGYGTKNLSFNFPEIRP